MRCRGDIACVPVGGMAPPGQPLFPIGGPGQASGGGAPQGQQMGLSAPRPQGQQMGGPGPQGPPGALPGMPPGGPRPGALFPIAAGTGVPQANGGAPSAGQQWQHVSGSCLCRSFTAVGLCFCVLAYPTAPLQQRHSLSLCTLALAASFHASSCDCTSAPAGYHMSAGQAQHPH